MRITFLGTGTGHQLPDRSTAAIDCDGWGTHFLIDVGSGALRRIREAGINPDTIEAVFITHVHPDHVADLIPLIQMYLLSPPGPRTRTLHLFGPTGLTRVFWEMARLMLPDAAENLPFKVELHEIESNEIQFGEMKIISRPVSHSSRLKCLGYRFSAKNKSFACTGDSGPCPALSELGQGVNLYIMECTSPSDAPADGHLTPAQLAPIAQKCQAGEIILTHVGPLSVGHDLKEEAREFTGEITVAEDLLEVKLWERSNPKI